jgi:3-hydroxyisobutyrate dehydrogenase
MASPIVKVKLPSILNKDYADTQFALRWMLKDLRYALELAHELGVQLPILEKTIHLYAEAEAHGWGSQDYAAAAKLLE